MRLFRGEEHVRRAYDEPGAIFAPDTLWELAQRWYGDRLDPGWTPHTRERNQADLAASGLRGPFFELPQASR
jgi:hypothetical protein